jgi:hypothetical protein
VNLVVCVTATLLGCGVAGADDPDAVLDTLDVDDDQGSN